MFYCFYQIIRSNIFKECGWLDLYKYEKEEIPTNMTEARVHKVSIYMFVYANLASENSSRCNHTSFLIFINKSPIYWYTKSQATVESSTF